MKKEDAAAALARDNVRERLAGVAHKSLNEVLLLHVKHQSLERLKVERDRPDVADEELAPLLAGKGKACNGVEAHVEQLVRKLLELVVLLHASGEVRVVGVEELEVAPVDHDPPLCLEQLGAVPALTDEVCGVVPVMGTDADLLEGLPTLLQLLLCLRVHYSDRQVGELASALEEGKGKRLLATIEEGAVGPDNGAGDVE
mmetsp:Transcript_2830/g.5051  ORF Transcript_2830/g.5051 Transcript_2830/m.5051 type:complete len:200 (+) Transcript_2830:798-1397(+)